MRAKNPVPNDALSCLLVEDVSSGTQGRVRKLFSGSVLSESAKTRVCALSAKVHTLNARTHARVHNRTPTHRACACTSAGASISGSESERSDEGDEDEFREIIEAQATLGAPLPFTRFHSSH